MYTVENLEGVKRLLSARTQKGEKWNAQSLSLAAGLNRDAVRDILGGRNRNPSYEAIAALMAALKPDDLKFAERYKGSFMPIDADYEEELIVKAAVAAGVWREHLEWPADEWYPLRVGSSFLRGDRFAVRMEGFSMDRTIPPMSDLECARVSHGDRPQPGDLVIVERTAHDLTELTCKRLDIEDDEWILRPESTKPEFQDVIRIGRPDRDEVTDEEVRVVGIVVRSQQRHYRPR